jgi:hypothetical protein
MEEVVKKQIDKREFNFRLIAGSLFTLSWLVLIGMKLTSDISLKIPLYFSMFLTIMFIISIFGKRLYNLTEKFRESEENEKPLTEEEISRREELEVKKMWNYVEKGVPVLRRSVNVNNSAIYVSHVKLYREINFGEEKSNEIIIITNATFKALKSTILPSNCGNAKLGDAINKISKNPYNPDIEETELTTDTFGKPIEKTKRISYSKPSEEKKEGQVV